MGNGVGLDGEWVRLEGNGVGLDGERGWIGGGTGSDLGGNGVGLGGERDRTRGNWVGRGIGRQSLYEIQHFDLCIGHFRTPFEKCMQAFNFKPRSVITTFEIAMKYYVES